MGFFEVIKNKPKKLKVKKNVDALEQVFNYYSFFGKEKHKFNQEIIEKILLNYLQNIILEIKMFEFTALFIYKLQFMLELLIAELLFCWKLKNKE